MAEEFTRELYPDHKGTDCLLSALRLETAVTFVDCATLSTILTASEASGSSISAASGTLFAKSGCHPSYVSGL